MFDSPMAQNLLSLIYPFNFKRSSSKAFENARVRAHSGAEAAMKKWAPTADYLSHRIKGYSFEMVPFQ